MLPDLWRMADRRVKPAACDPSQFLDEPRHTLLRGIEHHVAADRWFHESPIFREGEDEATLRLRQAGLEGHHTGLFAHVLWELCLDRALMLRAGRASLGQAIDEGLRAAGDGGAACADIHHFSRRERSAAERGDFQRKLAAIFRELGRGPWLDRYLAAEGIAEIVGATRKRVGLEPPTLDDHVRLVRVAGALAGRAGDAVDVILATSTFAR
jgi:hypothetical protein